MRKEHIMDEKNSPEPGWPQAEEKPTRQGRLPWRPPRLLFLGKLGDLVQSAMKSGQSHSDKDATYPTKLPGPG
jgi:hypothetical protein